MWNHPEKYRIKPLSSDRAQDLKPNICADFTVEDGMSRHEAFTLFIRANFPGFDSWKKHTHMLTLADAPVACRYPLGYLQEFLHDARIYQNDLPFKRWLAFLDEQHSSLVPYRRMR